MACNYRKLFLDDDTFITAIKNTFIIAVIVGPGGYVLSFLLAWMINELPHKLGVVLTVIFYAPSMAGTAVVAVFRQIFSDDASGYLNAILRNLGHHQGSYFYGCPIPNMLCLLLFWHLCGRALVLDSFPS